MEETACQGTVRGVHSHEEVGLYSGVSAQIIFARRSVGGRLYDYVIVCKGLEKQNGRCGSGGRMASTNYKDGEGEQNWAIEELVWSFS